jgi:hypothetical protein
MSVTGSQQRIALYRTYYNVFPIEVTPSSVTSIGESIIYMLFVLKKCNGVSENNIITYASVHFPQYTADLIRTEINTLVRAGVLVILQPICRDWCVQGCPVDKTYAISWRADQVIGSEPLVLFLIQLVGGTRTIGPNFNRWFFTTSPNVLQRQSTQMSTKRVPLSNIL